MATFDEFWGRAGEGMMNFGIGSYNERKARKEAQRRLQAAQGPVYNQSTDAASRLLGEFGMLDADALAGDRFAAQEALLEPVEQKKEADLIRLLHGKGMLGISNYNPGQEGIIPDGTAMQPHLAAFYAAQNADRAKRSLGALDEGQKFADGMVKRAGDLQTVGGNAQRTGIQGQMTQGSPAANKGQLLKGIGGMLAKDPQILKDIWGFGKGLFSGFGGGWENNWFGNDAAGNFW